MIVALQEHNFSTETSGCNCSCRTSGATADYQDIGFGENWDITRCFVISAAWPRDAWLLGAVIKYLEALFSKNFIGWLIVGQIPSSKSSEPVRYTSVRLSVIVQ